MHKRIWVAARTYGLAMAALIFAVRAQTVTADTYATDESVAITDETASAVIPSTAFYIPGTASPATSTGKTGLFVVPASAPTTAPAFITTSVVTVLGLAAQFSIAAGVVNEYSPYALIYLGKGTDSRYHVYGLPLTGTTVPKPVQISNLSLAASSDLCSFREGQTNLAQPTTLFLLLQVPSGKGTCSGPAFVFEVVHYTDAASTAPKVVNVTTTQFSAIYISSASVPGPLGGMVMLNGTNLQFYTSDAFTSPKTLVTGVSAVEDSFTSTAVDADFYGVTKTGGKQYLYRVNTSGVAVDEYAASGVLQFGASDKSNVYFIDDVASIGGAYGGGGGTDTFVEEPVTGGVVTKMFSLPYTEVGASLIGSNGSLLVYASSNLLTQSATLNTLPVGVHSASAHKIGSFTGFLSAHMYSPTGGVGSSNAVIFANITQEGAKGLTYSSESLLPAGTVKLALKAGSQFLTQVGVSAGYIFQVQGITDTAGGYGGAKLYGLNISTGVLTPYTTTGGSDIIVPATYIVGVSPLSLVVGAGLMASAKAGDDRVGLIYNSSTHVILPVKIANTNVGML